MNIYLITQTEQWGYDTYDSAIVVSESAEEAKSFHPNGEIKITDESLDYSWTEDIKKVTAVKVGETTFYNESQVLLASFHAG